MIKLTDLLKELDLRGGDLDDNITLEQVLFAFLEDFQIDEDEFFENNDELIPGAIFNPRLVKKTTLIADGEYEFIVPSSYRGTLYLVNTLEQGIQKRKYPKYNWHYLYGAFNVKTVIRTLVRIFHSRVRIP